MAALVCKQCGADLTIACIDGETVALDTTPNAAGGYALVEGKFKRLVDDWIKVLRNSALVKRRNALGCMRYADHDTTCERSLKPKPTEMVRTRDIRPKQRRPEPRR